MSTAAIVFVMDGVVQYVVTNRDQNVLVIDLDDCSSHPSRRQESFSVGNLELLSEALLNGNWNEENQFSFNINGKTFKMLTDAGDLIDENEKVIDFEDFVNTL